MRFLRADGVQCHMHAFLRIMTGSTTIFGIVVHHWLLWVFASAVYWALIAMSEL
jgi:hypothetical protein